MAGVALLNTLLLRFGAGFLRNTVMLGWAGAVMFGMVAATGIRILASMDYEGRRDNVFVVADHA